MAVSGMLELVLGRDSPGAPATSLWFSIPAVAVLVLPLFVRRRGRARGGERRFEIGASACSRHRARD
jgi:hypothetical protein